MNDSLSVSQALSLAKNALNQIAVSIVGEVSELSNKPGYKAIYFTLSDEACALSCLLWKNQYAKCDIELNVGMLVEVKGTFSLYTAKGRMNFEVNSIQVAGEGEQRLKVARLAKKLEAEGLMAPSRKKPLEIYPQAIAVVTSPRGKAIHDVLRTLRRRYPIAEVLVCGVPVEGIGAAQHIIAGLDAAQKSKAQVILLVRGGGSYEDLMPFNDEALARAIASSRLPVVTGIGHEPDNSIADMVADYRASTPTAAAEHVAPNTQELHTALNSVDAILGRHLKNKISTAQADYAKWRSRVIFNNPEQFFAAYEMALEGAASRLSRAIPQKLIRDEQNLLSAKQRLQSLAGALLVNPNNTLALKAAQLEGFSPLKVLGRGYSIAFDRLGHVVDSLDKIDVGDDISLRFVDGVAVAKISSLKRSELAKGSEK